MRKERSHEDITSQIGKQKTKKKKQSDIIVI